MADFITISDTTSLADIDCAIARLAIWRHASPKAAAQVELLLEERFARSGGV